MFPDFHASLQSVNKIFHCFRIIYISIAIHTFLMQLLFFLIGSSSTPTTNCHKHLGLEIVQVQSMSYTHNGKSSVPGAGLAKHSLITPLSIRSPFHSAQYLLHPHLLKCNNLYYKMLQNDVYNQINNNLEQTVSKQSGILWTPVYYACAFMYTRSRANEFSASV